ncbi:kynureninase-like [Battus philenor]|uniref:kynureninase-like n=1 Tax=Battus philenor TaxID=42288 RepID=UPI0035CEDF99
MGYNFKDDENYPKVLDEKDPLRHFRERFYQRDGEIYLCGNIFGLASIDAENSLLNALDIWKRENFKIFSENEGKYLYYPSHLAKLMAPLVKAIPEEVTITGSTTANIHQAISTFYKPTKTKYKILIEDTNFPSNRYAVDSQVLLKGLDPQDAVKVVYSEGKFFDEDLITQAMTPDVALVLLSAVNFKNAQILDMKLISAEAKKRDIIIGWDLCHAIGAIELDLPSLDVDFAAWCTYKHLNGGGGCPAGLYINRKHFHVRPGLAGWYGNRKDTQFLMLQEFDHQKDADGWQIGSPNLFSMSTLEGTLQMFNDAVMENIRKKSLHITAYLMYLVESKLGHFGFTFGNPREDSKRGGHVCLEHAEGREIALALGARGVVTDFKPPIMIRLGPVALYTSYTQVYRVVEILLDIMNRETYKSYRNDQEQLL